MAITFNTTAATSGSSSHPSPVFVPSREELKARLRMSSAVKEDTNKIIDEAMLSVRAGLFDRVGTSRVAELQAITLNETNPTSAQELARVDATQLETKWVRLLLLRQLPTLFFDASAQSNEVWNEEPLSRNIPSEREIERLEKEIDVLIGSLVSSDQQAGDDIQASSIGPDQPPPRPFESVL